MSPKEISLQRLFDLASRAGNLMPGATQFVFYRGNPDASIVLVGEAPGKDEDIQGKPFVGSAGKLLDKALIAVGLNPIEDVYITNIIKSRPPNNRKPTFTEMATERPLVIEEIKCIKPRVVCTLGASPLEALLQQKKVAITKIRGEIIKIDDFILIPTLHPAYLLRNRKAVEQFVEDLKLAKELSERAPK